MANNETTTKFKVDISELKKSMQEARKQVAYANSEFKAVSSSLDDWSKSSDGLNAKLKQLKSNLDSQETVLKEYENILEEVKKEYGENSKEAMEYATKLNNQQAVVNKIKKEMAGYEDTLEEVSKAEKIASKTGKEVSEVLDEMANNSENAGDGFTVFKGAIATFVGNGLTSLVGGLRDAATSILGLAESTREYRNQMAKLESASSEAGYSTTYTANKYKELYGVLADETAVTTTISNFMALETSGKTLDSLLNSSIGIWAKYGDSIALDGLAEAVNHTSQLGSVQGNLADALEWGGITVDEFNAQLEKCNTEQERQQLIATTLDGLYGELANTYKENNASVIASNQAQAEYTKTLADMGARIEPVTTTLKTGFTDLLNTALALFGGEVNIENFTTKLEEGFGVLTETVLPAVKDGLGWIKDNKDIIIAGLTGIATGFAAFKVASLIMSVTTAIKGFTTGLTLAQAAMKLLNLVIAGNPIGMLVTIILTVVTTIATFIATNDEARAKFLEIWENIKTACGNAINSIGKFFTETFPAFLNKAIEFLKQLPVKFALWLLAVIVKVTEWRNQMITKAQETALAFVNKIIEFVSQLGTQVWTWLVHVLTLVAEWGINLANKGREAAQKLVSAVVEKVQEITAKIKSIGSDIVTGLWNGINDKVQWLKDKIKGFVGNVTSWLKQFFEIGSPSKLMAREIGRWLPEGIAVGVSDNAKSVLGAMKDLTVDTVGSVRAGLSTATTSGGAGTVGGGVVNNFTQVINSPKQLSRLDIYRQSKNLLGFAGGGI